MDTKEDKLVARLGKDIYFLYRNKITKGHVKRISRTYWPEGKVDNFYLVWIYNPGTHDWLDDSNKVSDSKEELSKILNKKD